MLEKEKSGAHKNVRVLENCHNVWVEGEFEKADRLRLDSESL